MEQHVSERARGISEKKLPLKAQLEELEYLDETKSRSITNISHDFRTPLTLVQVTLEQILSHQTGKNLKIKSR
ncbi:MAG TPA: hypothetical protein VK186_19690 [Candidatus Deferrimicrobium sp.]|nr:hypothetical protein [Candidatus Deferrimicrobium sp.]